MSKSRFNLYRDELNAYYESTINRKVFEEESMKLMNQAFKDFRLSAADFTQLCKLRAEMVVGYG